MTAKEANELTKQFNQINYVNKQIEDTCNIGHFQTTLFNARKETIDYLTKNGFIVESSLPYTNTHIIKWKL